MRTYNGPPATAEDLPYHRWLSRWRVWRRGTALGPEFDLVARIRAVDDEVLQRWAADLPRDARRWLSRPAVRRGH